MDLLLGIIPIVCKQLDHVDFVVGGDGSKKCELEKMVEREGLQERVRFLGSVPHANVPNVIRTGHIFLNCSLTESFCIAILEAASCGLLVVSTNVGGVPEVLPEDMIHLSDPTVESMSASLCEAVMKYEAPAEEKFATERHQLVRSMYSWSRVAHETCQVYRSVLSQKRRGFLEQLDCYLSIGGITGFVVSCLSLIIRAWVCVIEMWQPKGGIDTVPDLKAHQ